VSELNTTAARVLAVAARDAARRLRDECKRLIEESDGGSSENRRLENCRDQSDYLIGECNDAIGAWTTAADVQPPPEPKCRYDSSVNRSECEGCRLEDASEVRGVGLEPPAAAEKPPSAEEEFDAVVASLAKSLSGRLGVPVVAAKFEF